MSILKRPSEQQRDSVRDSVTEDAVDTFQSMLRGTEGNSLRTWLRHFDTDHDFKISFSEFCQGMARLNFQGDCRDLFVACDTDESGYLTLDEIDEQQARVWDHFRNWSLRQFSSARHMMSQLSGRDPDRINPREFQNALKNCGWKLGFEELLFQTLDINGAGIITYDRFKWFDEQKKYYLRKEEAKAKSQREQAKRQKEKEEKSNALKEFKKFLVQKFSSILRAWRKLDADGSMAIQKHELFKACAEMGWNGDKRSLWKGLDKDGNGVIRLDEFDLLTAGQLGEFKEFCRKHFGSAVEAFAAFDEFSAHKLKESEFLNACKHHGFYRANKALFQGLDSHGRKYIITSDIKFVDHWKPPRYLHSKPSEKDAQLFKKELFRLYHHYIKAWRACLDRDNSNAVTWDEFDAAARQIKFAGDVGAAWKFLDSDLSGFITLEEIDKKSHDILTGFKLWANEEFGSVKQAYEAFDASGTRVMCLKEFKRNCVRYGYEGNARLLFDCLDGDETGELSLSEVIFLDDWEISEEALTKQANDSPRDNKKPPTGILGIVIVPRKNVDLSRIEKLSLPKIGTHSPRTNGTTCTTPSLGPDSKLEAINEALSICIQPPTVPYKWTARASRKRMLAHLAQKRPFLGM